MEKKVFDNIEAVRVNASEIEAMTIGADIISVNNEGGHFEIGDNVGITAKVKIANMTLEFVGGILVKIIKEN